MADGIYFTNVRDINIVKQDDLTITDKDWVSNSFMVRTIDLEEPYNMAGFSSLADFKFTDTSMGGNISINTSPQFTRTCDIRARDNLAGRKEVKINEIATGVGMGGYYSTAIDDNSINVFFEFGVAEFNNVLFYLLSAVDYKKSIIANSGRSPIFYNLGYAFGLGALFLAFPIITVGVLLAKFVFNTAMNLLASNGRFDHYYLKPTMFLYWSTVNSLVTMMSTELGILSPFFMDKKSDKVGMPLTLDNEDMSYIQELMPGLVVSGTATGYAINVHAMVSRTQKLYNKFVQGRMKGLVKLADSGITDDTATIDTVTFSEADVTTDKSLWDNLKDPLAQDKSYDNDSKGTATLSELLDDVTEKIEDGIQKIFGKDEDGSYSRAIRKEDGNDWVDKTLDTAKSIFNEGARYAVFRVEHNGSITESFSNSTSNVEIGDKINALGQTWRNLKFNLGAADIPIVGDVAKAVTDFAVGALDGVTLGLSNVIGSFLSGASVETAKRWSGSTTSLPSQTFKMKLIAPTAHPLAQLKSIYIPLASIMAAVLPLSTGPRSYTSPFLCNMFIRGNQRITLGMITSLSITRGTSNLPYNKQRRPLAIDVSFTVTDFSDVVSAPIVDDLLDLSSVAYDDESGINKYIQSLCARDLYSTVHVMDRAKIKLSKFLQTAGLESSPEYWGARIGDMGGNSIFSVFGDRKKINYSELY